MNLKQEKYFRKNRQVHANVSDNCSSDEEDSIPHKHPLTRGKKKARQRQENSLGELTKNFIEYIKEIQSDKISINEAVKKLKVKKRRIYDITNVLEGIGYIKKLAKNEIEWLKKDMFTSSDSERCSLQESEQNLQILQEEERCLDNSINEIKKQFQTFTETSDFKEYGYVTFEDIKTLTNGEDINLIAIKAPAGTSLEIPDPDHTKQVYEQTKKDMDEGREEYDQQLLDSLSKKHQLFLDSPNGEISVYLVLSKNDEDKESNKPNLGKRVPFQMHGNSGMNINSNILTEGHNNFINSNVLQTNRSLRNANLNPESEINNFS